MKILFLALSALLFLGCTQEKKQESQKTIKVKTVAKAPVKEAVAQQTEVKEVPKAVAVQTTPAVIEKKAIEVQAPVVEKKVVEVKEVKTEVVPKEVAVIQPAIVDGAVVFKKCAGCHGLHAEKKALGKSHIIKDWNKDKIIAALHGYKNGTYGGAMKGIMKGQAGKLSNDEISAVAEYISKL
jgi:cytochrome c553